MDMDYGSNEKADSSDEDLETKKRRNVPSKLHKKVQDLVVFFSTTKQSLICKSIFFYFKKLIFDRKMMETQLRVRICYISENFCLLCF